MDKLAIENTVVSLKEVMESLRDLKIDARNNDFHIQALTFVANTLIQDPKDKGEAAINEVFRYAKAMGIAIKNLDNFQENIDLCQSYEEKKYNLKEEYYDQTLIKTEDSQKSDNWLLLKEIMFGAVIGTVLLWLIQ